MTCSKCIYWELDSEACRNNKALSLIFIVSDDHFSEESLKFDPTFGCIFFEEYPQAGTEIKP